MAATQHSEDHHVIRYDEVSQLEGEQAVRVRALVDRSSEIWDLPETLEVIEIWERQITDCEAEGVPHLAASAMFGQYVLYFKGGLASKAFSAYARLMQHVNRFGDHIANESADMFAGTISELVARLRADPRIPLEGIQRVTDLAEEVVRVRGFDIANIYLARAEIASERGDEAQARDLIHRWLAVGSEEWGAQYVGTALREAVLLEHLNPYAALQALEARCAMMGLQPGPLDMESPDLHAHLMARSALGKLYAWTGRRDIAAGIGDGLRSQFDLDHLMARVEPPDLLAMLEHRPEEALVVADHVLSEHYLDGSELDLLAAATRARALADPHGEETSMLRTHVTEVAAARDARSGTDAHSRGLRDHWFSGLEDIHRPAIADDPEVWGDVEERAERILRAGWLQRHSESVTMGSTPMALNGKYQQLIARAMEIHGAETAQEADALVDWVNARSEELRMPTARFGVSLMRAFWAFEHDDYVGLVHWYSQAQQELLDEPRRLWTDLLRASDDLFPTVVSIAIGEPGVSLDDVGALTMREGQVRQVTGAPQTQLLLAQAVLSAHVGDAERLQTIVKDIRELATDEADTIDAHQVDLELIELAAPYSGGYAEALARNVLEKSNSPEIRRPATAWLSWFAALRGEESHSRQVMEDIESVGHDLSEFGSVPTWVLVELAADHPDALPAVLEAALDDIKVDSGVNIDSLARIGTVLQRLYQDDPRGTELIARALRIAELLDERDGHPHRTARLRQHWPPEEKALR